jgi:hypothetical protein
MELQAMIDGHSASGVRAEADSRLTWVLPLTLREGQTGISGLGRRDTPDHGARLRMRLYSGRYYSETPTVFNAGAMRAMCDHLTERHGRPWTHVLA